MWFAIKSGSNIGSKFKYFREFEPFRVEWDFPEFKLRFVFVTQSVFMMAFRQIVAYVGFSRILEFTHKKLT